MTEVAATVRFQCEGLREYISKAKEKDPLIETVWEHQAIKRYKSKKDEMEEWETEITTKWTSKQLHGHYKRQVGLPEITSMENACRWMRETTGLKIETEALITAAQDQALDNKCLKVKILHTKNYPKCRLCKEKDDTIAHRLSACPKIVGYCDFRNNSRTLAQDVKT